MENNFIIDLLSKCDVKSKLITLSNESQFTRKFGKGFWVIFIGYLSVFILDIIRLLFFANDNPGKFGGTGYYMGGEKIWFMADICQFCFTALVLSFLYLYHQDDNEWLMNINQFYKEV